MPSKRQTSSSQSASSRPSPSTSKSSAAAAAAAHSSSISPSTASTNNTSANTTTPNTKNSSTTTTGGNSSSSAKPQSGSSSSSSQKSPAAAAALKSSSSSSSPSPQEILSTLWENYYSSTPQRTKLIDAFMGFLVVVGGLQFLYCVLVGNYPFNAFLSGFSATVGQFVLTASLRIQTNPANQSNFASISPERAFADFILGSLILHFFCVNFIN